MTRFAIYVWCCVVLAGCNTSSPPPTVDTAKTVLFGGIYEFEVEKYTGTNTSLTAHRANDGAGNIEEFVDYEIGSHRLKVVNGALTLDDKNCGTLKQGDKVRFTASGKLYVNGTERP